MPRSRFTCEASAVKVDLAGGRKKVSLPGFMLYDPSGQLWPNNSLLVAPFDHEGRKVDDYSGFPKHWLGRTYKPHAGGINIPPRSGWETVDDATCIYYLRRGSKAPGGYHHPFNKPRGLMWAVWLFKGGDGRAIVRRLGRLHRIDFPNGLLLDDRGIVWP